MQGDKRGLLSAIAHLAALLRRCHIRASHVSRQRLTDRIHLLPQPLHHLLCIFVTLHAGRGMLPCLLRSRLK